MAEAVELATAYINLVPSMQGAAGSIGQQLGGPAVQSAVGKAGDKAGKTWSGRFGKAGKAMTFGAVGALVAVGAAGLKAGMEVDEAYDTIRAGTGKTGKALEGLQGSFRNVAKKTPADMAAVGQTVSDLNQRLGLTGPTLEKLSRQILEAGRLGGVDVDVKKVSGAFSAFGVQGKDTTKRMDDIFRVSQATGVGINDLAGTMAKSGGVLKQLGFGFTESASLLGVLDKAGVNSRAVVSSMGAGLVKLAKDGEAPQDAFKRVSAELQGFVKSGDDAAALELAGKVFGTRGAGQFISALKSGKVNLDDLAGSANLSKDTILGVAQETKDFPELWTEFKNTATLALAPIGEKLMPAIGNALKTAAPLLQQFANWFGSLSNRELQILLGIGAALVALGPVLWIVSKAQAAWTVATTAWVAITKPAVALQKAMTAAALGTRIQLAALAVQQRIAAASSRALALAAGAGRWVAATAALVAHRAVTIAFSAAAKIAAAGQWLLNAAMTANPIGLIIAGVALLVGALVWFFTKTTIGKKIVKAAWAGIKAAISGVATWWTKTAWPAIRRAIDAMGDWFRDVGRAIGSIWRGIKDAIGNAWRWIDRNVFAPIRRGIELVRLSFRLAQLGMVVIWTALRTALRNGWQWIDRNVFARIRQGIEFVRLGFHLAGVGVRVIWSRMQDVLRAGWGWIDRHVFAPIKRGLGFMGDAFRAVPGVVRRAWDKIKAAAAKPINFVIQTVYMNGIKKTWDKIADAVGLDLKLPTINPIAFANGSEDHRAQIARGGALRMWAEPETGGEAYIPLASSKRGRSTAILSAVASKFGYGLSKYADGGIAGWFGDAWEKVKDVGSSLLSGPASLIKKLITGPMNSALGSIGGGQLGKIAAALPRKLVSSLIGKAKDFASSMFSGPDMKGGGRFSGGPVMGWQNQWNVLKNAFPGAQLFSAYRPGAITAVGTPSFHGKGRAIDVSPSMAIFNWLAKTFPNSSELIFSPAGRRQLYMGRQTTFGEPTRSDHFDHVHWAMANGGLFPSVYDRGGWMPPGGVGVNRTTRPEAVLDPEESRALKAGLGNNAPLVGTMVVADPRQAMYYLEQKQRRARTRAGLSGRKG